MNNKSKKEERIKKKSTRKKIKVATPTITNNSVTQAEVVFSM